MADEDRSPEEEFQELMRRLIAEEDSSKPLSDARLTAALQEQGGEPQRQDPGSEDPEGQSGGEEGAGRDDFKEVSVWHLAPGDSSPT